jgi:hypothetical protein
MISTCGSSIQIVLLNDKTVLGGVVNLNVFKCDATKVKKHRIYDGLPTYSEIFPVVPEFDLIRMPFC